VRTTAIRIWPRNSNISRRTFDARKATKAECGGADIRLPSNRNGWFPHEAVVSQEELGDRARINRTYISKLETGAIYLGLEIIGMLAKVLGAEPAKLVQPT